MACIWEYRDKQGAATSSEIRFYETGSWAEQSRLKMPEPGYTCLESWKGNHLWYSRCSPGNTSLNEQLIDVYLIDTSVSYPENRIASNAPVHHGFSRSYANPNYVREYQVLSKQGHDWYVIRTAKEAFRTAWLESLRSKPYLTQVINRFWPRETLALEFYRTSTQQKLNRMSIHPNSKYCLSEDGQWLAGFLQYNNQLCLYSTAPVPRWPGWFFVGAFLILLFCKRLSFWR